MRVDSVKGNYHYAFSMWTDTAPFNNNDVRMALKLGINRQELIDKILSGYGSLGNDHPIGAAYPEHSNAIEQRVYDPDRALWHLRQAGLSSLDVRVSAADAAFPGSVDAATLYSASSKKAGINLQVVREANDGYWSSVWLKKPFVSVF
ncbi:MULTISPECIES: ABC transporter substrate-binding protein [unclassified Mesorhizobium]|uniref:ABC transporter substrate-binding protein n=1 Tax=unclassified Mesorhizobium TaxID=325217 RepID=UPI00296218A7|nr:MULTISPECIES: ABC transporter substrate-binding protein [unclassified Mesorhizobium]